MSLARFTRWQAAPIHLMISAAIAATVMGVMLFLWYPRPYFEAAGGLTLLMLLIGVDVVIGPLLTLIVFDPTKKYLKLDLAIIATLQLAALTYGAWVMFDARPVYVAFAGDRFELVSANEIAPSDLDKAAAEYRSLPVTGPRVVGTKLPTDIRESAALIDAATFGGSIGLFPKHYVPYSSVARDVLAKAQPLSKLRQRNPEHAADIDDFIAASHKPESSLRYVPLQSRRTNMTVLVDATNGEVQAVLPIDPW